MLRDAPEAHDACCNQALRSKPRLTRDRHKPLSARWALHMLRSAGVQNCRDRLVVAARSNDESKIAQTGSGQWRFHDTYLRQQPFHKNCRVVGPFDWNRREDPQGITPRGVAGE